MAKPDFFALQSFSFLPYFLTQTLEGQATEALHKPSNSPHSLQNRSMNVNTSSQTDTQIIPG